MQNPDSSEATWHRRNLNVSFWYLLFACGFVLALAGSAWYWKFGGLCLMLLVPVVLLNLGSRLLEKVWIIREDFLDRFRAETDDP